jgi:4-oxalomesaconate tautomerase
VIVEAAALGRTGHESPAELGADQELRARVERLRLACGRLMGLGDVTARNYPKMTLVSAPAAGGTINTRSFIPHVCHESVGVLAAVTVATACVLRGTVAHRLLRADAAGPIRDRATDDVSVTVSIEHPSGEFSVRLGLDPDDPQRVTSSALLRTARLIMAGQAMVPRHRWQPTAGSPRSRQPTEKRRVMYEPGVGHQDRESTA